MNRPTCITCFWWERNGSGSMGVCRGQPPTAICVELKTTRDGRPAAWQTMWCATNENEGCRDHETEQAYVARASGQSFAEVIVNTLFGGKRRAAETTPGDKMSQPIVA